ncbi:MAG: 4-amino-4-deoxychorismate lyase [Limimaricola sp.]|uniref:aminotransferase class IV n=1 Tax=Limimaricola sp. TaxID=2211665 RepID=UPI001D8E8F74|nr:aminotransferase class IV [Limimaricola sp.]MBI1415836.1 4-amino-4-deoxychorismate lyase [Limimaricola sp.]
MESAFRGPLPAGLKLIETMGWRPGEGVRWRDRHMARMAASAARLGLYFEGAAAARLLDALTGEGALRVRLTLGADGFDLTTAPLPPAKTQWHLALAEERLEPHDPWLGVKTTQRALYDSARAALPPGIDEVLFLNTDGLLCEGTITNVFLTMPDGAHLTPARRAGLLPGILRGVLLEQGWREADLTLADLRAARAVAVGNALRGLIPARLA